MDSAILKSKKNITIKPYFICNRINTKVITRADRLAASPVIVKAGKDGCAVLFRYGVIVFFGTNEDEETLFIEDYDDLLIDKHEDTRPRESAYLAIDSKATDGFDTDTVIIKKREYDRLQVIAEVLARSVVLDAYEEQISQTFDTIEPIAAELQNKGPKGRSAKKLMRHIGHTLSIQRKMIGQVEVEGKPDVLWDRADLEKFYLLLEDEYEITERHNALKNKLELIHQTAETMLSILGERRTLHVEWYIVFLILFDIIFMLWEKYWPHV